MNKYYKAILLVMLTLLTISLPLEVRASASSEEMITITVDAEDENGGLTYAIDSNSPDAFGTSNKFVIEAGTSHIIYVKDGAGNVSSQYYSPALDTRDTQKIDIDLEIGNSSKTDYKNYDYEYISDTPITGSAGTASVSQKITTNAQDTAERVFYTINTEDGETFYMIIDQTSSSNNVYLLNAVSLDDLKGLATDTAEKEKSDNLLSALTSSKSSEEEKTENITEDATSHKRGDNKSSFAIVIVIAIGGGAYYYFKIYRNKKNEAMDVMEAMDLDEFAPAEEMEDEISFDEEEQQEYLEQILHSDEEEDMYSSYEPVYGDYDEELDGEEEEN